MKHLFRYMTLLAAVLLTACSSDESTNTEQPLPEGMGRIRITVCTPETDGSISTRAVTEDPNDPIKHENPWETPDHEWERLQTFRIYICSLTDGNYVVRQVISGNKTQFGEASTDPSEHTYRSTTVTSESLEEGTYYIFATANFRSSEAATITGNANDEYDDGYAVGSTINLDATKRFANSSSYYVVGNDAQYSVKNIPMTGWQRTIENGTVRPKPIGVSNGAETDAGTLMLWRVIGKMQFEFTNESDRDIRILGIEVDPINKLSTTDNPGIYLFSKDDLTSTADLAPGATPPAGKEGLTLPNGVRNDMGPVAFTPALVGGTAQPLTLAAKTPGTPGTPGQGKLYFYVNESDATFTTTKNQLSLRFKVQRKKDGSNWYDQEIRYGVTTQHDLSNSGPYGGTNGGFNVIRRNDWIHIPVTLTDWQLRIEPIAFVPIAGYPAKTVSSDGLTATFSTGGIIALQPFVKKYSDATWRDFSDPEITYGMGREVVVQDDDENDVVDVDASWVASIHWINNDGDTRSGDGKIVKKPFTYDATSHCIIGELNQALVGHNYMTTFTIEVTLGPKSDSTKQYGYSFTFNVVLQ
ncbi:MAG: hypothetical protein IKM85_02150 [Bacteroidales bacterium]|nr:hypothetical protein [Prevotella sp.]MBR3698304.1 hypothetical protein [Bacteroidales bacterium]